MDARWKGRIELAYCNSDNAPTQEKILGACGWNMLDYEDMHPIYEVLIVKSWGIESY